MGRAFICPDGELHGQAPSSARRRERAREEFGEIGRLLVALHRREDEFDRPLGGDALGLERIGEAQSADGEIGLRRAAAIELASTSWPSLSMANAGGSSASSSPDAGDAGRACRPRPLHAEFARRKRAIGIFELRIGEEEDALALQGAVMQRTSGALALAGRRRHRVERARDARTRSRRL
jgi:hypothetical protein